MVWAGGGQDLCGIGTVRPDHQHLRMLDQALEAVGPARLLWGADITLETGLAKLRALEVIGLPADELAAVRWRNAARIFPAGTFSGLEARAATSAARGAA